MLSTSRHILTTNTILSHGNDKSPLAMGDDESPDTDHV